MVRIPTCHVLGAAIRQARKDQGLTQAQVAARAGVSRPWLSQMENGKRSVETGKVLAVLDVLSLCMEVVPVPRSEGGPDAREVLAHCARP